VTTRSYPLGNRGRGLDPRVPGSVQNIFDPERGGAECFDASVRDGSCGFPVRRVQLMALLLGMLGGEQKLTGSTCRRRRRRIRRPHVRYPAGLRILRAACGRSDPDEMYTRAGRIRTRVAMVFDDVKDLMLDGSARILSPTAAALWLNDVAGRDDSRVA